MEQMQSKSINYGDVIHLGEHILINGDCHDKKIIEAILKNKKVRTVLTDPPYGVNYVESKKNFSDVKANKDIINDDISSEKEYIEFTEKWIEPALPHLETKNNLYIFNSDKLLISLIQGLKNKRINFSQLLIWIKNNSIIGRKDYLLQHELIISAWYKKHYFRKGKDKSVLFSPKPNKNILHPTMKPISLLRRIILNSSNIGDYIYDPFGGSGSTLIACEQTKRKCLMVELDKDYCYKIIKRYYGQQNKKGIKK